MVLSKNRANRPGGLFQGSTPRGNQLEDKTKWQRTRSGPRPMNESEFLPPETAMESTGTGFAPEKQLSSEAPPGLGAIGCNPAAILRVLVARWTAISAATGG